MNHRDLLINGLRHQGWQPYTKTPHHGATWEAYHHPHKTTILWLTAKGQLRVGKTPYSSEPVQQTYIERTITLGRQQVR